MMLLIYHNIVYLQELEKKISYFSLQYLLHYVVIHIKTAADGSFDCRRYNKAIAFVGFDRPFIMFVDCK